MQERTRVLITGATSGLGRELALQLGRRGWRVAVTGRRADRLESCSAAVRAAGGESLAMLGSVTDRALVKGHYAKIREAWGGLDWTILNAGVSDSKPATEFSAENYEWTLATNVIGAANWIEAVLPDMLARRSGTIAGVASLAGFRGLPNSGAYSTSKAAFMTLLESLRVDLRGTGVRVVTITPGFVKSEITARNDPQRMPFLMETADGARAMIRGIESGRRVVHFPWQLSYLMKYVVRNLPGFLYDPLVCRFGPKRKRPASN